MQTLRRQITFGVLLILITTVLGCSWVPETEVGNGPPLSVIKSERALGVQFPGARRVTTAAHERENTIEGQLPASAGVEFESTASFAEVVSYYGEQLLALGWITDQTPVISTVEAEGSGWCKPAMVFRLTARNPISALSAGTPNGSILISARIIGSTEACPQS